MKEVKGIIFDMDGVIFDTESIYYQVTKKVADELSVPYNKKDYLAFIGVSDKEVHQAYHRLYHQLDTKIIDQWIKRTHEEILEIFATGQVALKKGVYSLLKLLEERNIPSVIASSNNRKTIELLVERAQIGQYFSAIISAEDVSRAKPDPEIFLQAVMHLQTPLDQTLIIEDSYNGIKAANAASIPVIMIPDLLPATEEIKQKTVAILSDLTQFSAYLG